MNSNLSDLDNPVPRGSLPPVVQRWLDRAIPKSIVLPEAIQIEQEGTMDIRERWTPFRSKGIYKASPLSFIWQARFQMMPGVWINAEDGHLDGQGWGGARLWGLISMGKRTDPEVYTSQLIRNLGELPLLPAFVMTESSLNWADKGERAFEVSKTLTDREITVQFELNEDDDIVRAYSPARPYDVPGGFEEAPWTYEFSDHREFEGVRIPAAAVARFDKNTGPWEYFRGRVTGATFR